jgi:hypothetical protein
MYAPANLLRYFLLHPETKRFMAFKKYVHFPLSKGMIIGGGRGLATGTIGTVVYDGENNLMTADYDIVAEPTDMGSIEYLLQNNWEEFNP